MFFGLAPISQPCGLRWDAILQGSRPSMYNSRSGQVVPLHFGARAQWTIFFLQSSEGEGK
jgi:hypothetical protein